jgi:hypothetical protein
MKRLLFLFVPLLALASCASVKDEEVPEPAGETEAAPAESTGPKPTEKGRRDQVREVTSLEQIRGSWASADGYGWEYPFELNGRVYLHRVFPEHDDTEMWAACASRHNTTVSDLWGKRFSYYAEIYGRPYPVSDERGTEVGVKLRMSEGRVICREERLIPEEVAGRNTAFFLISDGGVLRTRGQFDYFSGKFPAGKDASRDGTYVRREDYWGR